MEKKQEKKQERSLQMLIIQAWIPYHQDSDPPQLQQSISNFAFSSQRSQTTLSFPKIRQRNVLATGAPGGSLWMAQRIREVEVIG